MMVNAQKIRRQDERAQRKALRELNENYNHTRSSRGRNTTSNGVRQIVSLEKLEGISKMITISEDEIEVVLRLRHTGRETLQLIQLLKEIDGWIWNDTQ